MYRRQFCAAAGMCLAAGCGQQLKSEKSHPSPEVPETGWTQHRGGPTRTGSTTEAIDGFDQSTFDTVDAVADFPPVANDRFAVLAHAGGVSIWNLKSSTPVQVATLELAPIAQPAISGSTLLVTTRKALSAFDLENGEKIWERLTTYRSVPLVAFGSVVIAAKRSELQRIDVKDGTVQWSTTIESGVASLAGNSRTSIVVQNTGESSIIVGYSMEDGSEQWRTTVEQTDLPQMVGQEIVTVSKFGRVESITDGESRVLGETEVLQPRSAAVSNSKIIVGPGTQGNYACFNRESEEVVWRRSFDGSGASVLTDRTALFPVRSKGVVMVDLESGSTNKIISLQKLHNSIVPVTGGLLCSGAPDRSVSFVRSTGG